MNQEKILFVLLAFSTVYSVVNIKMGSGEQREFEVPRIERQVVLTEDFDISSVLDDTPLTGYFNPKKRNPFVPVWNPDEEKIRSEPTVVEKLKDKFRFPWLPDKQNREKAGPEKKPDREKTKKVFKESQIKNINIPPKPGQEPVKPTRKISKDKAKKDKSIPVYLIGFAKVGSGTDRPRKALIAHKKTGKVYTVQKGDNILGLHINDITPYSIIIKMSDGNVVEFLNDILKEKGRNGTGRQRD